MRKTIDQKILTEVADRAKTDTVHSCVEME